jgi:hypothetical protein
MSTRSETANQSSAWPGRFIEDGEGMSGGFLIILGVVLSLLSIGPYRAACRAGARRRARRMGRRK